MRKDKDLQNSSVRSKRAPQGKLRERIVISLRASEPRVHGGGRTQPCGTSSPTQGDCLKAAFNLSPPEAVAQYLTSSTLWVCMWTLLFFIPPFLSPSAFPLLHLLLLSSSHLSSFPSLISPPPFPLLCLSVSPFFSLFLPPLSRYIPLPPSFASFSPLLPLPHLTLLFLFLHSHLLHSLPAVSPLTFCFLLLPLPCTSITSHPLPSPPTSPPHTLPLPFLSPSISTSSSSSSLPPLPLPLLPPPVGIDLIVAFYGCLYAGCVPITVRPPHPQNIATTLPTVKMIVEVKTLWCHNLLCYLLLFVYLFIIIIISKVVSCCTLIHLSEKWL